jgi:DNA-binding NtrC family response regulator
MANILLLDDEEQIRRAIELHLKKNGHRVVSAENGQKGLEILAGQDFDLIITDLQMPEVSGTELLKTLDEKNLLVPTIVLTGYGSVESAVEAMKLGASDYITKPPQLDEITLRVEKIISRQKLVEENRRLKKELEDKFDFEGIIGKSHLMLEMFEKLKPLAEDRNISILLIGETGTGKELTAKAIHYNSPRKDKPFVAINCGALPEHLLESELFGHEKGAFTDAKQLKKGLFETAQGGTLFLDEISSMPLEMQVKLLRAIEENEIRRVGGTKNISLDIRFIAASNQDLEKLIKENKFRRDLFYRLAVATVTLPPLRLRNGDIRLLIRYFLEKFNREKEKSVEIDADVINILDQYEWRGNVRELENLIELNVVTAIDGKITSASLPENIIKNTINQPIQFAPDKLTKDLKTATRNIVENFEREFLSRSLKKNKWNISKTAEEIGISRGALHGKIKQYGLKFN